MEEKKKKITFNKYLTLILYKKITLYATVLLKQFATAYYYNPYLQQMQILIKDVSFFNSFIVFKNLLM